MPSSTSPSEHGLLNTPDGALPPGLRKTAADRPGQAQPVPTRDIPARPWQRIGTSVFIAVALMMIGWEWNARQNIGLRAGDIDDSPQSWAEQRRAADRAQVAIVGDSRILFDTDLARFEQLTGVRPVQVSFVGSSGRALLTHFANDPRFHGLLIVGMADTSYFGLPRIGLAADSVHNYAKNDKPSQLTGLWIDRWMQNYLAFMDSDYRLSRLLPHIDTGWRKGVDSPYEDVWKISETFPGRQYFMWRRIETDPYLRAHARHAWHGFEGPRVSPKLVDKVMARSIEAVGRIRARGGDVIFIRPPDSPRLRVNEQKRIPKALGWDRLLAVVPAKGIHADDLPPRTQGLLAPEWSHLSRKCATVFTDAYVRRLVELTPRLKLRTDAPPPLTRDQCVGPAALSL